jgi:hypothetical protein
MSPPHGHTHGIYMWSGIHPHVIIYTVVDSYKVKTKNLRSITNFSPLDQRTVTHVPTWSSFFHMSGYQHAWISKLQMDRQAPQNESTIEYLYQQLITAWNHECLQVVRWCLSQPNSTYIHTHTSLWGKKNIHLFWHSRPAGPAQIEARKLFVPDL